MTDEYYVPLVAHAPPDPVALPAAEQMTLRLPEAFKTWCVAKAAAWSLNGRHYEPEDALRWVLEHGRVLLLQREADEAQYVEANSHHRMEQHDAQFDRVARGEPTVVTDLPISDFRNTPVIPPYRMPRRQPRQRV